MVGNSEYEEPSLSHFNQGLFEPEDLSNSAPLKLYLLCTKYIVNNIHIVNIKRKVPSEVSENLIEAFRLMGTRTMVSRFLTQISGTNARVNEANLTGLDIKNHECQEFIASHARTLRSININNCCRLGKNIFQCIIEELIKVRNPLKLQREVTCYEVDEIDRNADPVTLKMSGTQFLWRKTYSNMTLKCEYQNTDVLRQDRSDCSSSSSHSSLDDEMNGKLPPTTETVTVTLSKPLTTDYDLHRAMGLFKYPDFIFNYTTTHPLPHRLCRRKGPQWVCNGTSQFEFTDMFRKYFDLPLPFSESVPNKSSLHHHLLNHYYSSGAANNNNNDDELLDEDDDLDELDSASLRSVSSPMECRSKGAKPGGGSGVGPNKRLSFLPYRRRVMNRSSSSAAGHCGRFRCNSSSTPSATSGSASVNANLLGSLLLLNEVQMEEQTIPAGSSATGSPTKKHKTPYFQTSQSSSCEEADEELIDLSAGVGGSGGEGQASHHHHIVTDSLAVAGASQVANQSSPGSSSLSSSASSSSSTSSSASCPSLASSMILPHQYRSPYSNDSAKSSMEDYLRYFWNNSRDGAATGDLNESATSSTSSGMQIPNPLWSVHGNTSSWKSSESLPSTSSASNSPNAQCPWYMGFDMSTTAAFHPECSLDPMSWSASNGGLLTLDRDFEPYSIYRVRSIADPKKILIFEVRTWQECPLESLTVGKSAFPEMENEAQMAKLSELFFHPQLHNLKRLVLNNWPCNVVGFIPENLDENIANRLQLLDLSYCSDIGNGAQLKKLTNLKSLVLFNCQKISKALDNICEIKSLRALDISTSNDQIQNQYQEANSQLKKIVENLPNLMSLDISGTNLAGFRSDEIMGLESRRKRPLEFLGIFHTSIEASFRQNIPAKRIAGDSYEKYILSSCEAYIDRVEMLRKCLNELFQLFRYESRQHNIERSLKILVCALGRHPHDKLVQVAASATLFYIVKSDDAKPFLGRRIKELIVSRLLDAMQNFRFDQTMLRNGCLNLIHFRIPSDVINEYTRLADILLYIVTNDDDEFVQRLGIYLLNSLACQVDGEQKTIVGNLGAIEKMLQLIQNRYSRSLCDEVMETAWSTMWNVTDETPINCERFLNNQGMDLFKNCMEKFPECPELLRNMMGLLGNVSECAHLRYRLMKEDYITRFISLLNSDSDGIEVSYNSAGILAHIASDGPEIWNRHLQFPRDEMLTQMQDAISRWEINSKRNINYRSFEPILRILRVYSISWQAQYWAVWALANLTRVHSSKYCSLLEKDGGVRVLHEFIIAQRPDNFALPPSVKCLAVVTLLQYHLYRKYGAIHQLEESNVIHCFNMLPEQDVGEFLRHYEFGNILPELSRPDSYSNKIPIAWMSHNITANNNNNDDDDQIDDDPFS